MMATVLGTWAQAQGSCTGADVSRRGPAKHAVSEQIEKCGSPAVDKIGLRSPDMV